MYGSKIASALISASSDMVFIVGAARSGTSLLFNYLNESENIFLLNEDNAFSERTSQNFRISYNERWKTHNRWGVKGYHIPAWVGEGHFWFDCYLAIKNKFKLSGTKIAFGPFDDQYWGDIDTFALRFFQYYFYNAYYLLTIRCPTENLLSMRNMFPEIPFGTLKNAWIKTLQLQLQFYASMERCRFVFHDSTSLELLDQIVGALQVAPPGKAAGYVIPVQSRASYVGTDLGIKFFGAEYLFEIAQMEAAYNYLSEDFDKIDGREKGAVHRLQMCNNIWVSLERIRSNPNESFCV
jgi:hypothetical protein